MGIAYKELFRKNDLIYVPGPPFPPIKTRCGRLKPCYLICRSGKRAGHSGQRALTPDVEPLVRLSAALSKKPALEI